MGEGSDLLEWQLDLIGERAHELGAGLGIALRLLGSQPEPDGDGDQPPLSAIMKVTLDASALGVPGGGDPRAGLLEVAPRVAETILEAAALQTGHRVRDERVAQLGLLKPTRGLQ